MCIECCGRVQRNHRAVRVGSSGTVRQSVPAGKHIAVAGEGVGIDGELLAGNKLLHIHIARSFVRVEGQVKFGGNKVISIRGSGTERCAPCNRGQGLAGRISLAVGVVGLKDRIRSCISRALEVTAGDQRRMIRIGVVVLVSVGSSGLRSVNTTCDRSDFCVGRVVYCVIAGSRTVGVDLKALTQLADHGQVRRVGAAVLNADTVRGDDRILDRTDSGVQIRICVNCGSGSPFGVRGGVNALSERTGIVVNTANLFLSGGGDHDRIAAAVYLGDRAKVGNDLIRAADCVARTNQVNCRRSVIGSDYFGLAVDSVRNSASGIRSGNRDNVFKVVIVLNDCRTAVVQHSSVCAADRVVGHRTDVTTVVDRVRGGTGDHAVIDGTNLSKASGVVVL